MRTRVRVSVWLIALAACSAGDGREVVRLDESEGSAVARPPTASDPSEARGPDAGRVVFLGTSLTAGMGLADPEQAYPGRIQEKIDSVGLPWLVVNAGVSGETSAGGLRRLDWILEDPVDVLVVELGANDGLRGHPPQSVRTNLLAVVDRTRSRYPDAAILIVAMEAPPNLGPDYTDAFRSVFSDVARERNALLVPFLLDGVAGVPELNQDDGIHPTAEGHALMAERLWEILETVLRERRPGHGEA